MRRYVVKPLYMSLKVWMTWLGHHLVQSVGKDPKQQSKRNHKVKEREGLSLKYSMAKGNPASRISPSSDTRFWLQ